MATNKAANTAEELLNTTNLESERDAEAREAQAKAKKLKTLAERAQVAADELLPATETLDAQGERMWRENIIMGKAPRGFTKERGQQAADKAEDKLRALAAEFGVPIEPAAIAATRNAAVATAAVKGAQKQGQHTLGVVGFRYMVKSGKL